MDCSKIYLRMMLIFATKDGKNVFFTTGIHTFKADRMEGKNICYGGLFNWRISNTLFQPSPKERSLFTW